MRDPSVVTDARDFQWRAEAAADNALQNVYTHWMDDRPVVWDSANRKHIGPDHLERGITPKEVEEILSDPNRIEVFVVDRQAYQVVGRTTAGRWLVVIWIDQPEGRYPIHARTASKRIIRRLSSEG